MHNMAPVINLARRGRTLRLAFVSAVVSLVAAFAAVGSTIPLYNIYRAEDGFTNAGISMAVVAYSVGTHRRTVGAGTRCPIIWAAGPPRSPASVCSCWAVCCC